MQQMQEFLVAASGQSDAEVAGKLVTLQLTERVSSTSSSNGSRNFPAAVRARRCLH
jgi:hypothetical protein